jgi:hypothetical protein
LPSGNSNGRRRAERFTEPHGYGHTGRHRNRAHTSNANRNAIVHGANSYCHQYTLADAAICDVGSSRNGNAHPGATLRHFHSGTDADSYFGTGLRNSHRSVDGDAPHTAGHCYFHRLSNEDTHVLRQSHVVTYTGTAFRNCHPSVDGNAHSGTPFSDCKPISVADVGIGRHLWQRSSGRG